MNFVLFSDQRFWKTTSQLEQQNIEYIKLLLKKVKAVS